MDVSDKRYVACEYERRTGKIVGLACAPDDAVEAETLRERVRAVENEWAEEGVRVGFLQNVNGPRLRGGIGEIGGVSDPQVGHFARR